MQAGNCHQVIGSGAGKNLPLIARNNMLFTDGQSLQNTGVSLTG